MSRKQLDQGIDLAVQVEELERINRRLQQNLVRSKARTEALVEAVCEGAREAAAIQGRPQVAKPKPRAGTSKPEAAVLMVSDWHIGKQTPSFNSTVAVERVKRLGDKVAKLTHIERADHPVPVCHAMLGGDFIENINIFPGQAYEVDSTSFAQLFVAARAVEGLLLRLLGEFPTVEVWEAMGNHGRIGRRGDFPREDNLDLLLYRIVRERLEHFGRPRLIWHMAESWFTQVRAGLYEALLIHGDQIKTFGGNVPAYGIQRKGNAWASGVLGVDFADIYMGHFHQAISLPLANGRGRVFVNPSLESDSAYAQEMMAATGTPGQRLNFVNPQRGRVTSERVIWLDE